MLDFVYLDCSNNATLSLLPGHNTCIIKVLLELIPYQLCSDPIMIRNLKSQWSGPSFWSPALGKQGGLAVFVNENSRFEVLHWQRDSTGRIISLLVKIDDAR